MHEVLVESDLLPRQQKPFQSGDTNDGFIVDRGWIDLMITPDSIAAALTRLERADLEAICQMMLAPHFQPVFGSAKAVEHEVAAFKALQRAALLEQDRVDEFSLVKQLRITRSKARNLLYAVALRQPDSELDFSAALRKLLLNPRIHLDPAGRVVSLEVVEPFLMDQVREPLRCHGFLSDGSFSGSIARMSPQAFSALLEEAIPPGERKTVEQKLRKQGLQGKDWTSLVVGLIGRIGEQVAGAAGGEFGQALAEHVFSSTKTKG